MKPVFSLLIIIALLMMSCGKYNDDPCLCGNTNNIGGWENGDTTSINHKKDSIGGLAIELGNWADTIKTDITL